MSVFISHPAVTVACGIAVVIIVVAVLVFAPVQLMLAAIRGGRSDDEADFDNDDYLVHSARAVTPGAWPREFEQEPRGM